VWLCSFDSYRIHGNGVRGGNGGHFNQLAHHRL
jgi:hypothetical protein